jgi:hypothetical protein
MEPVVAFAPLAGGVCVLLLRPVLPASAQSRVAELGNFLSFSTAPNGRMIPKPKHPLDILQPPDEVDSMLDSLLA